MGRADHWRRKRSASWDGESGGAAGAARNGVACEEYLPAGVGGLAGFFGAAPALPGAAGAAGGGPERG